MAVVEAKRLLRKRLAAFERRRDDASDSVRLASERHESRLFQQLMYAGPDTALPQFFFKVGYRNMAVRAKLFTNTYIQLFLSWKAAARGFCAGTKAAWGVSRHVPAATQQTTPRQQWTEGAEKLSVSYYIISKNFTVKSGKIIKLAKLCENI